MGSNSFRRIALAQGLLRDAPVSLSERDEGRTPQRAETRREADEERSAQA